MNRPWIEARIPHQGRMCLLDEVIDWNAHHIRCRTGTHRAPDNPLRAHGRLGIACGIEYAAQAMALHGALATAATAATAAATAATAAAAGATAGTTAGSTAAETGAPSRVGLLASVREVRMHVLRLDDIESDLLCEVTHLAGDGLTALYEFALRDAGRCLLGGRASVVLDAGRRLRL